MSTDTAPSPLMPSPAQEVLEVWLVCCRGERLTGARQALMDILQPWGQRARVQWAPDARDVLRHLHDRPIALAVVDARMDRACQGHLLPALEQQHIDTLCMEELDDLRAGTPHSWCWSELPRALQFWLRRHDLSR